MSQEARWYCEYCDKRVLAETRGTLEFSCNGCGRVEGEGLHFLSTPLQALFRRVELIERDRRRS